MLNQYSKFGSDCENFLFLSPFHEKYPYMRDLQALQR